MHRLLEDLPEEVLHARTGISLKHWMRAGGCHASCLFFRGDQEVLMRIPLYITEYDARRAKQLKRASHLGREVRWAERVPALWRSLTIGPLWVDVNRDAEAAAERWVGYDEDERPCYCRYLFEIGIGALNNVAQGLYREDLSAWRMRDGRWLIHRIIHCQADTSKAYAFYVFSENMPR